MTAQQKPIIEWIESIESIDDEFDESDIVNISKKELNRELEKHCILCDCCTLFLFYKSISFISCLFIIFGFIGILIGNLMLNLDENDLLNASWILNASMLYIAFGVYGMFIFECYALRPFFFSLFFWWTIISFIIFITFTLICTNWKYWSYWYFYLAFSPIYILYFLYIYASLKIYSIIKHLTTKKNIEKINIIKQYSISHICIGIIINICLIVLYLIINKLSIVECEFISSSKQIVSNMNLQCQANKLLIQYNNNNINTLHYNDYQQHIIGLIWISFGILAGFSAAISFIILWKSHNYCRSMIFSISSLILSFISFLIWVSMDNVCNDETCIYYAKYMNKSNKSNHIHIHTIITKHKYFINSTAIQLISCLMWFIIIWFQAKHNNNDHGLDNNKHYKYTAVPVL